MSTTEGGSSDEPRLFLDLIARLREAWKNVRDPEEGVDLAALAPPGSLQSLSLLPGLLREDMALRSRRGHPPSLEHYLARFPELANDALLPELLLEEYRFRHSFGDRPPLELYKIRFPTQFSRLTELVSQEEPVSVLAITQQAPDPQKPVTGSTSLSQHYQLRHRLGAGTYGEVCLAEAPGGVRVALKRLFRPLAEEEGRRERA